MAEDFWGVDSRPGLVVVSRRIVLIQSNKQVDQLASDGLGTEQGRQFREINQPVRVPAGPIVISPIHDPENPVVSLGNLLQEVTDLPFGAVHLSPCADPPASPTHPHSSPART